MQSSEESSDMGTRVYDGRRHCRVRTAGRPWFLSTSSRRRCALQHGFLQGTATVPRRMPIAARHKLSAGAPQRRHMAPVDDVLTSASTDKSFVDKPNHRRSSLPRDYRWLAGMTPKWYTDVKKRWYVETQHVDRLCHQAGGELTGPNSDVALASTSWRVLSNVAIGECDNRQWPLLSSQLQHTCTVDADQSDVVVDRCRRHLSLSSVKHEGTSVQVNGSCLQRDVADVGPSTYNRAMSPSVFLSAMICTRDDGMCKRKHVTTDRHNSCSVAQDDCDVPSVTTSCRCCYICDSLQVDGSPVVTEKFSYRDCLLSSSAAGGVCCCRCPGRRDELHFVGAQETVDVDCLLAPLSPAVDRQLSETAAEVTVDNSCVVCGCELTLDDCVQSVYSVPICSVCAQHDLPSPDSDGVADHNYTYISRDAVPRPLLTAVCPVSTDNEDKPLSEAPVCGDGVPSTAPAECPVSIESMSRPLPTVCPLTPDDLPSSLPAVCPMSTEGLPNTEPSVCHVAVYSRPGPAVSPGNMSGPLPAVPNGTESPEVDIVDDVTFLAFGSKLSLHKYVSWRCKQDRCDSAIRSSLMQLARGHRHHHHQQRMWFGSTRHHRHMAHSSTELRLGEQADAGLVKSVCPAINTDFCGLQLKTAPSASSSHAANKHIVSGGGGRLQRRNKEKSLELRVQRPQRLASIGRHYCLTRHKNRSRSETRWRTERGDEDGTIELMELTAEQAEAAVDMLYVPRLVTSTHCNKPGCQYGGCICSLLTAGRLAAVLGADSPAGPSLLVSPPLSSSTLADSRRRNVSHGTLTVTADAVTRDTDSTRLTDVLASVTTGGNISRHHADSDDVDDVTEHRRHSGDAATSSVSVPVPRCQSKRRRHSAMPSASKPVESHRTNRQRQSATLPVSYTDDPSTPSVSVSIPRRRIKRQHHSASDTQQDPSPTLPADSKKHKRTSQKRRRLFWTSATDRPSEANIKKQKCEGRRAVKKSGVNSKSLADRAGSSSDQLSISAPVSVVDVVSPTSTSLGGSRLRLQNVSTGECYTLHPVAKGCGGGPSSSERQKMALFAVRPVTVANNCRFRPPQQYVNVLNRPRSAVGLVTRPRSGMLLAVGRRGAGIPRLVRLTARHDCSGDHSGTVSSSNSTVSASSGTVPSTGTSVSVLAGSSAASSGCSGVSLVASHNSVKLGQSPAAAVASSALFRTQMILFQRSHNVRNTSPPTTNATCTTASTVASPTSSTFSSTASGEPCLLEVASNCEWDCIRSKVLACFSSLVNSHSTGGYPRSCIMAIDGFTIQVLPRPKYPTEIPQRLRESLGVSSMVAVRVKVTGGTETAGKLPVPVNGAVTGSVSTGCPSSSLTAVTATLRGGTETAGKAPVPVNGAVTGSVSTGCPSPSLTAVTATLHGVAEAVGKSSVPVNGAMSTAPSVTAVTATLQGSIAVPTRSVHPAASQPVTGTDASGWQSTIDGRSTSIDTSHESHQSIAASETVGASNRLVSLCSSDDDDCMLIGLSPPGECQTVLQSTTGPVCNGHIDTVAASAGHDDTNLPQSLSVPTYCTHDDAGNLTSSAAMSLPIALGLHT